jgi:hypothetical protein
MPTAQEVYNEVIRALPPNEQLRLATLILNELVQQDSPEIDSPEIDKSDAWTEQDQMDISHFSLQYAASLFSDESDLVGCVQQSGTHHR